MTVGLVTIVKDDTVLFKCVAGSNGMNTEKVAEKIRQYRLLDITCELLYNLCRKENFGARPDLVIQSSTQNYFEGSEDLSEPYCNKDKFQEPKFNPRWESGLSDHCVVIMF